MWCVGAGGLVVCQAREGKWAYCCCWQVGLQVSAVPAAALFLLLLPLVRVSNSLVTLGDNRQCRCICEEDSRTSLTHYMTLPARVHACVCVSVCVPTGTATASGSSMAGS